MSKILIIEDNEMNMKLMKDILSSQNYEVTTAQDGQQGLDIANEQEFDLILLDIQMPVVSGYDFLKLYNKKTPVIVVSACAMDNEIQKATELGCAGYIAKPIQIMDFLNTVKSAINA